MQFGLMNVPETFQPIMNKVLRDTPFAHIYLDDIAIFSKELLDHTDHVINI